MPRSFAFCAAAVVAAASLGFPSPAFAFAGRQCDLSEVADVPPGTMVPDGTVVTQPGGHLALCRNGNWIFI